MAGLVPPGTTVKPDASTAKPKEEEKVDYMNLPCPIPYEEIHREALSLYLYHLYSYFTRHYNNSTELYVIFFSCFVCLLSLILFLRVLLVFVGLIDMDMYVNMPVIINSFVFWADKIDIWQDFVWVQNLILKLYYLFAYG